MISKQNLIVILKGEQAYQKIVPLYLPEFSPMVEVGRYTEELLPINVFDNRREDAGFQGEHIDQSPSMFENSGGPSMTLRGEIREEMITLSVKSVTNEGVLLPRFDVWLLKGSHVDGISRKML